MRATLGARCLLQLLRLGASWLIDPCCRYAHSVLRLSASLLPQIYFLFCVDGIFLCAALKSNN